MPKLLGPIPNPCLKPKGVKEDMAAVVFVNTGLTTLKR
jgi:hypothetical protein